MRLTCGRGRPWSRQSCRNAASTSLRVRGVPWSLQIPDEVEEPAAAGLPRVGCERPGHGGEVEELQLLCALDGAPQVVGRHDGREIQERPGHGGRRNAIEVDDLVVGSVG